MNRTVVITGASSGIGQETAAALAAMGDTVVMTSRDPERGAAALADVRARSGSAEVHLLPLDLASFASIRAFATEVNDRFPAVHVLVNNAGVVLSRRQVTAEGFEMMFGVNHLGHFLLTDLLLDRLRAGADDASGGARVVTVSSVAQRFVPRMPFGDLQSERRFSTMVAYSVSKLANVLFANELARRLDGTGVTSNSMHPVAVRTNFAGDGDTSGVLKWGMAAARPLMLPPAGGARTVIHLAASPEVAATTGGYFALNRQLRQGRVGKDPAVARRLWDVSRELVDSVA